MSAPRPFVTDPFPTASQLGSLNLSCDRDGIYIAKWNRFLRHMVDTHLYCYQINEMYACAFAERVKTPPGHSIMTYCRCKKDQSIA